jgi:predicted phage terminase large subunit-like protein
MITAESWESLCQGEPKVPGGKRIKDKWWKWCDNKTLPRFKFKFITADTAQKKKKRSDWTVFQCWGYGFDDRIYLIDRLRDKFEAPELRIEAELFYKKHNKPRINITDPVLRAMFIEDRSSGTGLIQELRKKRVKVVEIPRSEDKEIRCDDASPEIRAGRVVLNTDVEGVENIVNEASKFPDGEFDDDIDTTFTAIEVAFINGAVKTSLQAAMEAAD